MSWFKKIVSRILGDEIEETSTKYNDNYNGDQQYKSFDQFENDYDYENYENEEETRYIEDYHQDRTQVQGQNPNYMNGRESFKFPIIQDEGNRNNVQNGNSSKWMNQEEYVQPVSKQQVKQTHNQDEQKPLHLSDRRRPEQYSPFVREPRGLRGVVEKPSRENYNPFNPGGTKKLAPQPKSRPIVQAKPEKKIIKDPVKTVNIESKAIKVIEVNTPEEPKKKFIPTRVPSPIYGFQTPPKRNNNIYDLLDEKEKNTEKKNDVTLKNTAWGEVAASSPQLVEKTEETVSNSIDKSKVPPIEDTEKVVVKENGINKENHQIISEQQHNSEMDNIVPIEENDGQVQNAVNEHIVEETTETNQITLSPIETRGINDESEILPQELEVNNADSLPSQSIESKIEEPVADEVKVAETTLEVSDDEAEVVSSFDNDLVAETVKEQTTELELLSDVTIEQSENESIQEIEPILEVNKNDETPSDNTVPLEPELIADTVNEKTNDSKLFTEVVLEHSENEAVEEVESIAEIEQEVESETELEAASTTAAIEQANVQELNSVQETVQELEAEIEPETIQEIQNQEEPKRTGSRVPFNVVMLKSDKAKMEQIRLQEIPLPGVKSFAAGYTKATSAQNTHVTSVSSETNSTSSNTIEKLNSDHLIVTEEKSTVSEAEPAAIVEISALEVEQEVKIVPKEENETMQNHDTLEQHYNTIEVKEPAPLNEHLEEALSYLEAPEEQTEDFEWMDAQGEKLIEALSYFQIDGEIVQIVQGPAVTQFEITVGHGIKVSKIRNLADDLKLALAARDIRIQAPIPGKSSIGIEIPNRTSRAVRLSEVVNHSSFIDSKSPLEAALGLDLTGEPVTIDLRKMPHGMIAGATGSGKSVCINSLLISLLLKASPQDVKLMLIDPKMVELAPFNHIPHLVSPVITDVKAATAALKWAVDEMDRRYQLFAHVGARDITRYNKMVEKERKFSLKMPYLVIVIDELADLMMMSPQEVEESICRIAQKARACGIHLVLATQRPSVDVITGLIKSNIPTRIAFSVSSHVDSRTILDSQGAERLLGRGDMLYLGNGMSAPVRVQGTYVTDDEIEAVTDFVRTLGEPEYLFQQEELLKKVETIDEQDELFEEACRYICSEGSVSASSLQRKYRIGYNRAARLVDMMEAQGFISESRGTKPREVFLTERDLDDLFG
ncbi:DNA translocase FtsK [Rummeliibacillus sp. JY-2-4R]